MDADPDLLLTTVFVMADDLLPERHSNAARRVTDTEDFTLCVAQAVMGSRPTGGFSPSLPSTFSTCFDSCSSSRGTSGRRRRLADTLDWLMGIFASQSPGFYDDLLVVDWTTVECAHSRLPAGHRPGHYRHMTGWPDPNALIRCGFLGRGNGWIASDGRDRRDRPAFSGSARLGAERLYLRLASRRDPAAPPRYRCKYRRHLSAS